MEIPSLVILDCEPSSPAGRQNFQKTDSTRAALIAMFYQTSLPCLPRLVRDPLIQEGKTKDKKERRRGRRKERKKSGKKKEKKGCGSPDRLVMNLWVMDFCGWDSDEKQKEVSRTNLLEEESAILEDCLRCTGKKRN